MPRGKTVHIAGPTSKRMRCGNLTPKSGLAPVASVEAAQLVAAENSFVVCSRCVPARAATSERRQRRALCDEAMATKAVESGWTIASLGMDWNRNRTAHLTCVRCGAMRTTRCDLLASRALSQCPCTRLPKPPLLPRSEPRVSLNKSLRRTWYRMIRRCHIASDRDYKMYGAKGITVCDRWRLSFNSFAHDMGLKPTKFHSIDRINNRLGYEPGNCRWATDKEQQRNRTNNRTITYDGQTMPLAAWEERLGLPPSLLSRRLRSGWSETNAIETPHRPRILWTSAS